MFSVFEKLKFALTTKYSLGSTRKERPKKQPKNKWVIMLKNASRAIVLLFVSFMVLGLTIYYLTPPTINVTHSFGTKIIYAEENPYMIKGYVSSGTKSHLTINAENIELVGSDFTHTVNLKEGDNRFVFEATNDRGVTKEIYVVNYSKNDK